MAQCRIGLDTGGTFTDLVLWDEAAGLRLVKVPSTPHRPDDAIVEAYQRLDRDGRDLTFFGHGTTVGLNALIERKGARVGLITTKGFRDVLEIARFNRPDMYNLFYLKPRPLVRRDMRLEVDERVRADGSVARALDPEEFCSAVKTLLDLGAESVAVSFLNAYANPVHEEFAAGLLRREFPGVVFALSTGHAGEWREYERTSTAVLNAYLAPRLRDYVGRLSSRLESAGVLCDLLVMRCDGGLYGARAAVDNPVSMLFSGPAAAVLGAARLGEEAGRRNLITVDIGGTSCDVSLVAGGDIPFVPLKHVDGYPVQQQVVDVHSIGAGGGTIAWVDSAGMLKVGPASAGADPGPACYGHGGTRPTVTDAYLLLGWIDPDRFLGGEFRLYPDLAAQVFEPLASGLGLDLYQAAHGVIRILEAAMAAAVRVVSVDRGHDPRDFSLMAFGGAGPLHAAALARELGAREAIVPQHPAHLAALGILLADVRRTYAQTLVRPWNREALTEVRGLIRRMSREARRALRSQGFSGPSVRLAASIEMRYAGQEHTLQVGVPSSLGEESLDRVARRFRRLHLRQYSFALEDEPCEVVAVRLDASGLVERPTLARSDEASGDDGSPPAPRTERKVCFVPEDGFRTCSAYDRASLLAGARVQGPAIIEEPASNTVLPPGFTAVVGPGGHLFISTDKNRR